MISRKVKLISLSSAVHPPHKNSAAVGNLTRPPGEQASSIPMSKLQMVQTSSCTFPSARKTRRVQASMLSNKLTRLGKNEHAHMGTAVRRVADLQLLQFGSELITCRPCPTRVASKVTRSCRSASQTIRRLDHAASGYSWGPDPTATTAVPNTQL